LVKVPWVFIISGDHFIPGRLYLAISMVIWIAIERDEIWLHQLPDDYLYEMNERTVMPVDTMGRHCWRE
jgi:hypothetical protein